MIFVLLLEVTLSCEKARNRVSGLSQVFKLNINIWVILHVSYLAQVFISRDAFISKDTYEAIL